MLGVRNLRLFNVDQLNTMLRYATMLTDYNAEDITRDENKTIGAIGEKEVQQILLQLNNAHLDYLEQVKNKIIENANERSMTVEKASKESNKIEKENEKSKAIENTMEESKGISKLTSLFEAPVTTHWPKTETTLSSEEAQIEDTPHSEKPKIEEKINNSKERNNDDPVTFLRDTLGYTADDWCYIIKYMLQNTILITRSSKDIERAWTTLSLKILQQCQHEENLRKEEEESKKIAETSVHETKKDKKHKKEKNKNNDNTKQRKPETSKAQHQYQLRVFLMQDIVQQFIGQLVQTKHLAIARAIHNTLAYYVKLTQSLKNQGKSAQTTAAMLSNSFFLGLEINDAIDLVKNVDTLNDSLMMQQKRFTENLKLFTAGFACILDDAFYTDHTFKPELYNGVNQTNDPDFKVDVEIIPEVSQENKQSQPEAMHIDEQTGKTRLKKSLPSLDQLRHGFHHMKISDSKEDSRHSPNREKSISPGRTDIKSVITTEDSLRSSEATDLHHPPPITNQFTLSSQNTTPRPRNVSANSRSSDERVHKHKVSNQFNTSG